MEDIKKEIDEYIKKCKPKYFNREEINGLINLFEKINIYINEMDKKDKNNYININNENIILKSKLEAIKNNLNTNIDVQDILKYLDNLKKDDNIIIGFFLKIFICFLSISFYIMIKYNNQKIQKQIINLKQENLIS